MHLSSLIPPLPRPVPSPPSSLRCPAPSPQILGSTSKRSPEELAELCETGTTLGSLTAEQAKDLMDPSSIKRLEYLIGMLRWARGGGVWAPTGCAGFCLGLPMHAVRCWWGGGRLEHCALVAATYVPYALGEIADVTRAVSSAFCWQCRWHKA